MDGLPVRPTCSQKTGRCTVNDTTPKPGINLGGIDLLALTKASPQTLLIGLVIWVQVQITAIKSDVREIRQFVLFRQSGKMADANNLRDSEDHQAWPNYLKSDATLPSSSTIKTDAGYLQTGRHFLQGYPNLPSVRRFESSGLNTSNLKPIRGDPIGSLTAKNCRGSPGQLTHVETDRERI